MSGLVLKLSPSERFLINGAVIENGERRAKLAILTPDTRLLRLRDAIHPEDAKTPVAKVCYIAQLALSGDTAENDAASQILRGLAQLRSAFDMQPALDTLQAAEDQIRRRDFYRALKTMRGLLTLEAHLLQGAEG